MEILYITIGVLALIRLEAISRAHLEIMVCRRDELKRKRELIQEMDQISKEWDDLRATYKVYYDLEDKAKCKEIEVELNEKSCSYSFLRQRL